MLCKMECILLLFSPLIESLHTIIDKYMQAIVRNALTTQATGRRLPAANTSIGRARRVTKHRDQPRRRWQ